MQKTILGFNGIRGLAALAVVFTHTAAGFTQFGGFAVNLFFVLSGFLILQSLHQARLKMEARSTSFSREFASFWKKRALRIVPAYLFVISVGLALVIWEGHLQWHEVFFYATYTQNFYMAYLGHWLPLGHTWTLAVEQQFYVLIAPLMLLTPASRHLPLLLGIICVMAAAIIIGFIAPTVDPFAVRRMPFIGILLGCVGGYASLRPIRKVSSSMTAVLFASALIMAAIPITFLPDRPVVSFTYLIFQILACTAVISFVATRQEGKIVRFLENRILVFLGLISYSIYLVHVTIAELLKQHWVPISIGDGMVTTIVNRLLIFVVCSLMSVAAGYLSWRFIEMKFQFRRPSTHHSIAAIDHGNLATSSEPVASR